MKTEKITFVLPFPTALWAPVYLAAAKIWYGLLPTRFSVQLCYPSDFKDRESTMDGDLDAAVANLIVNDKTGTIFLGACDPYKILDNPEAKAIATLMPRMAFWAIARDVNLKLIDASEDTAPLRLISYPAGMTGAILANLVVKRLAGEGLAIPAVEVVKTPSDVIKVVRNSTPGERVVGITADPTIFQEGTNGEPQIIYSFSQDPELSHYLTTCVIAKSSLWFDNRLEGRGHEIAEAVVGAIQLALLELRKLDDDAIGQALAHAKSLRTSLPPEEESAFAQIVKMAVEQDIVPFSVQVDQAVWKNGIRLRRLLDNGKPKPVVVDLDKELDAFPAAEATRRYILGSSPSVPRPDVLFLSALEKESKALIDFAQSYMGVEVFEARDSAGIRFRWCVVKDRIGKDRVFVFAESPQMGETPAASTLGRLIADFSRTKKPKCLAMNGICAGHPYDTKLGDLIVGDRLFKFDDGKVEGTQTFGDLRTYILREPLRHELKLSMRKWMNAKHAENLAREKWFLRKQLDGVFADKLRRPESIVQFENWILSEFPDQPEALFLWTPLRETLSNRGGGCEIPAGFEFPESESWVVNVDGLQLTDSGKKKRQLLKARCPQSTDPNAPKIWETDRKELKIHMAPIGTGSKLHKSEAVWEDVRRYLRKCLGVEMEAAAVGWTAQEMDIPFVVAKAVVDHANIRKDDTFQDYACWLSTSFLFDFFLDQGLPSGLFDQS